MSLSDVLHAARQGKTGVTETVAMATDPHGKRSLQYALSVGKIPKYRLSPAKVDQYIVAIATIRSD